MLAISQATQPDKHSLALAALVSWLITEAFGAYMLTAWIGSGGIRRRDVPGAVPKSVIFGHAGLAFTGFVCWVLYVLTGQVAFSWVSISFLAPAIGLGISTVTLWTPYPTPGPGTEPEPEPYSALLGITTDEMLVAALEDEALTTGLVDELVASVLDQPGYRVPTPRWQLSPLVPVIDGVLAMATILFTVIAAVSTS